MKIFFKIFTVIVLSIYIFNFNQEVKAVEIPSGSNYQIGSGFVEGSNNCPLPNEEPGEKNLVSLCGTVKEAMPVQETLSDGTIAERVAQHPAVGVTVLLYECDNTSPTCKIDGELVHPFSSTSTNEDGKFHLVGRKMDNNFNIKWGNNTELEIILQSKKRYLVFRCGNSFQGLQVIPSYYDLTDIVQEVDCAGETLTYTAPTKDNYDFVSGIKLANQIGISNKMPTEDDSDAFYSVEYPEDYLTQERNATQTYFGENNPRTNQSIFINLKGADPRFTEPGHEPGKIEVIKAILTGPEAPELKDVVPEKGAWWSLDCWKKYEGTIWQSLCAVDKNLGFLSSGIITGLESIWGMTMGEFRNSNNPEFFTLLRELELQYWNEPSDPAIPYSYIPNPSITMTRLEFSDTFYSNDVVISPEMFIPEGSQGFNVPPPIPGSTNNALPSNSLQIPPDPDALVNPLNPNTYQNLLYTSGKYTTQHLLPNISPFEKILYYRAMEARLDLIEYAQDPADVARFLGSQYSNCAGKVFLRWAGMKKEQAYPDCEWFKECDQTINTEGYRNSYTTIGPAKGFQTPVDYEQMLSEMDPDIPICVLKDSPTDPVKLGEIQPKNSSGAGGYRLSKDYWNTEFLVYFGKNNTTAKQGWLFENEEDSYSAGIESAPSNYGGLDTVTTCDSTVFKLFEEAPDVPMSGCTSATITSGGKMPNNTLLGAYEISSGDRSMEPLTNFLSPPNKDDRYNQEIASGTVIKRTSGSIYPLGEYSKVNPIIATGTEIVTEPNHDEKIYDDHYFGEGFVADENHYPFDDFTSSSAEQGLVSTLYGIIKGEVPPSSLVDWFTGEVSGGDKGGPRTPTSGLYITTAAWNRIRQLPVNANWAKSPDIFKDSLDSLISAISGHGFIDWVRGRNLIAKEDGSGRPDLLAFILSFFTLGDSSTSEENQNKTFFDRKNADKYLGSNPDKIDSLLATGFYVNESNFTGLFPLPTSLYSRDNSALMPDDWGAGNICYPWNRVALRDNCETYQEEPFATNGDRNQKVSRTCQVNVCTRTTTPINCTCKRTVSFNTTPVPGGTSYDINDESYTVECEPFEMVKPEVSNVECNQATKEDVERRLTCAQDQITCYEENSDWSGEREPGWQELRNKNIQDCVKEVQYTADIEGEIEKLEKNDNLRYCNERSFPDSVSSGTDPSGNFIPSDEEDEVSLVSVLETPTCIMYIAGPNECDGDINRNTNIRENQQITSLSSPQEKVDIDSVTLADIELMKSFRAPDERNIVGYAGAFNSVETSMKGSPSGEGSASELGSGSTVSVSKRKDVFGPGAGNDTMLRQLFGHPSVFSVKQTYQPIYLHCNNLLLQSFGQAWNCEYNTLPEPEVLTMDQLNSIPVDRACSLNTEGNCEHLVLGDDPVTGEPLKFSYTFKKIMDLAGTSFGVPPSVLLTYLNRIGATHKYSYYWSEQGEKELQEISLPWYGTFKYCDDLEFPAQHPYDWILQSFVGEINNKSAGEALDSLAEGRRNTASRCNFLDATYAEASALSLSSFNPEGNGGSCRSYSWEDAIPKLRLMTFGNLQLGAYGEDMTYENNPVYRQIFDSCRY